ncbi:hypothetical protein [Streptomyces sp. NBC_01565]|uniref:hypothetical protein n=1 Tax=unclassified Streptomyces TaxID=2593676 RepID=UPI00224CAE8F|nr:hypothetical protein [Streptomyces sp. NBC_01565]MCX4539163.1 hypothetical protein [Streptomyces sp. NBC_01565]
MTATLVTVLVAAGGLFFTAVTTYYATEVAVDQLKQSREDDETKERKQAELVSAWSERLANGGSSGVISNRSWEPITEIAVIGHARPGPNVSKPEEGARVFLIVFETLPPCAKVTLTPDVLVTSLGSSWTADTRIEVETVSFRDSPGAWWRRDSTKPLARSKITREELKARTGAVAIGNTTDPRLRARVAAAEPLKECDK